MTEIETKLNSEQEGDAVVENQPPLDSENEEKEKKWYWLPKIEREVTTVDEDTVEVCPSLLWLDKRKKLKCKKLKRRKR